MTTKTAPIPPTYTSGFCVHERHDRCRGDFQTARCRCDCHDEPAEPEPEPEPVDLLAELDVMDDVLEDQPVRHCPTCTCGGGS